MSNRGGINDVGDLFKDAINNIVAEPLREVFGANQARKSLMDQRQMLIEAQAERAKEIADARSRAALNDKQASLAADTTRKAMVNVDSLGQDVFDPLGTASEQLGLTPPDNTNTVANDTSRKLGSTPIQQTYERNFLGL